ncbi:MAG: DUF4340 domain-containing protein [Clostridia bacterium]|nr:DUF4340 domain-containing protein [Clostridia bacterium]
MKKRTDKRLRNLAILGGVLVLLIAVFAAVKLAMKAKEDGESTVSATEAYTVALLDPQTLTGIKLSVRDSEELVFSLKDDATGWVWSADETVPLDNSAFANVVTALNGATSQYRFAEVPADGLAAYGLDDPRIRVDFSFSDGTGYSGSVGDYNAFSGGYYYSDGSDPGTVYVIPASSGDMLDLAIDDFILWEEPPELTAAGIRSVTFEKGGSKTVFTYYPSGKAGFYTDSFKWFVSVDGGEESPVSPSAGDSLVSALTSFGFAGCSAFRADTDYSAYGLDDPLRMTVAYTESETVTDSTSGTSSTVKKDAEWVLLLGSREGDEGDGNFFCRTESTGLVYTALWSDILGTLSGGDMTKILPAELVLFNPSMTDKIELSAGSVSLGVVITHGDSGDTYSNASGADLNYSAWSALADLLNGTSASSFSSLVEADPSVVSDVPVFSADFTFGDTVAKLNILPYSQNWYRVTFFGRDDQLITAEDLGELTTALEAAAG